MSQPIALIARIALSEVAFKKFLRSKAAQALAVCIDDTLSHNVPKYYIFRYLKAEQTLFAFFYFNHGNADSLINSTELPILQALATFADEAQTGYILAHLDVGNLIPDGTATAWTVFDQQCHGVDQLPLEVWPKLLKDSSRYFFKEVAIDFALNLSKKRIVDKSIVKKCQDMAEERRIAKLATQLDRATLLHPLHFFGDYFYNGEFIYYCGGRITLLREIDPGSFAPTPYGAADDAHIVVDGVVHCADVATFKKMQKGEVTYYKDAHQVFDDRLQPVPGADAASFRLKAEHYAEDTNALYFCKMILPKVELGAFEFHPAGYYHAEKLLLAETAVYMGSTRLEVDPTSFKVMRVYDELCTGVAYQAAYAAQDKDGTYLLYSTQGRPPYRAVTVSTDDPEASLARILEEMREAKQHADDPPPENRANDDNPLQRFREWADKHLERLYPQYKYRPDTRFYPAINNYFYHLFHARQYQDVLDVYAKIAETAWLDPHLFHHTACCYAALGKHDEALLEIRKALVFGYEHMEMIWQDEDLVGLRHDERFLAYQRYHADNPHATVPFELIEAVARLPEEDARGTLDRFVIKLAQRFHFPETRSVQAWIDEAEGEQRTKLLQYRESLGRIFDRHLLLTGFGSFDSKFYGRYKDHDNLHPLAHLNAIQHYFRNAHFDSGNIYREYMDTFLEIVGRLKKSLSSFQDQTRIDILREALRENPFFDYIVDRIRREDVPQGTSSPW